MKTLKLLLVLIFLSVLAARAQVGSICSNPVMLTVKSADSSCFPGTNNVSTIDVGSASLPPGNTCSTSDDNYWWGQFTATGTLTQFYMWGKDKGSASFIVYSGACANLTSILCKTTSSDDKIPMYASVATNVNQTYRILIHKKMTIARLCVYSQPAVANKTSCPAAMSFETGTRVGWQPFNGSYHLISAPGSAFKYDVQPGAPAARFAITNLAAGNDPLVGGMIRQVAPGGGSYSFRIGGPYVKY